MTAHAPDTILLSTDIYQGQGADWSYIHKDSGKHVFFYSEKGLIMLAEQFGYRCVTAPKFTLMHKQPLGKVRAMAVRQLLKRFGTHRRWPRILESAIVRSRPGANRDFEDLMRRGML